MTNTDSIVALTRFGLGPRPSEMRLSDPRAALLAEIAAVTLVAQPIGWGLGYLLALGMVQSFSSEIFTMPLVLGADVFVYASAVVALAALLSALIVRRRIDRHRPVVRRHFSSRLFAAATRPVRPAPSMITARRALTVLLSLAAISLAFADNASNGIEPAFAWSYTRRKRMADGSTREYAVEDHAYRLFRERGGDTLCLPAAFVSALDMTAEQHLQMLVVARTPWSMEAGTLTPTMKIKRARIEAEVAPALDAWYRTGAPVVWA